MKVDFKVPYGIDVAEMLLDMDRESAGAVLHSVLAYKLGKKVRRGGKKENEIAEEIIRTIQIGEKRAKAGRKGGKKGIASSKRNVASSKREGDFRPKNEENADNKGVEELEDEVFDGLDMFM